MNQNQTKSKPESAEQPTGEGLFRALFADLLRLHGEENGGLEDFYVIDETAIGCRYGDCCIRLKADGWHYGANVPAHSTPAQAFENRASDYHSEIEVETSGRGWMRRLVAHLCAIKRGFSRIGEVAYVLGGIGLMLPFFALTCRVDETMGEWHLRLFGKTLQDRFLHNEKSPSVGANEKANDN